MMTRLVAAPAIHPAPPVPEPPVPLELRYAGHVLARGEFVARQIRQTLSLDLLEVPTMLHGRVVFLCFLVHALLHTAAANAGGGAAVELRSIKAELMQLEVAWDALSDRKSPIEDTVTLLDAWAMTGMLYELASTLALGTEMRSLVSQPDNMRRANEIMQRKFESTSGKLSRAINRFRELESETRQPEIIAACRSAIENAKRLQRFVDGSASR
jgi:hypothetical protein